MAFNQFDSFPYEIRRAITLTDLDNFKAAEFLRKWKDPTVAACWIIRSYRFRIAEPDWLIGKLLSGDFSS